MRAILFTFLLALAHVAHSFTLLSHGSMQIKRAPYSASGSLSTFASFASHASRSSASRSLHMSTVSAPGQPLVKSIDKETNVAVMEVTLPGEQTKKAFSKACDMFNEEVKMRGYTAPGFRPGSKLPPQYLYQMFGETTVKSFCGNLLAEAIQDECEFTGLMFVGRGRITDFKVSDFVSGSAHTIEVECDLWPEILYSGEGGYKGLSVEVVRDKADEEKKEKVIMNIRERYKVLISTPAGYTAQLGDVAVVSMMGFEKNAEGGKGAPLPSVASGDQVEVLLEVGKFMPGMVEGIVGAGKGDVRTIEVTFPTRPTGPGAALSGKTALFELEINDVKVKTLPEWGENLAASIRDGMTLEDLNNEVTQAIEGDASSTTEGNRNNAIAAALLEITSISKLPESLVEENTQGRFQQMLADFKEQGSTDEQLQEMTEPEKYQRYKELSRKNVEKVVKLGMTFRDIAEKEKIATTPQEVQEQYEGILMQAKQKQEAPPDEARAKEEIDGVLLRKKVFDFIASHCQITYLDPKED
ncbi:trigger factor/SurA domain-containing protein [Ochromonadaceae sp. CCMP2298]|nr:trigger factor/SurA domain-containing protein [Ochromonadaceae sp. CCMP2298]|mmetsp:Transcript_15688/g.34673  ORF Transcript_15688/g.34673 Transcript_15688/m.34673 type:complete len:526 (+) Transcript_15688:154-1731(+)